MNAQHIINKTQQATSNPGTAVRICAGFYLIVVDNGAEIEIERINSNKWLYRSYDGDFYGEETSLKNIVTILQNYV